MHTTRQDTPAICGYHAHVYFNAQTQAQARARCESAAAHFAVQMGHRHTQPVGPQ